MSNVVTDIDATVWVLYPGHLPPGDGLVTKTRD
jgi:hypothetical protein